MTPKEEMKKKNDHLNYEIKTSKMNKYVLKSFLSYIWSFMFDMSYIFLRRISIKYFEDAYAAWLTSRLTGIHYDAFNIFRSLIIPEKERQQDL